MCYVTKKNQTSKNSNSNKKKYVTQTKLNELFTNKRYLINKQDKVVNI